MIQWLKSLGRSRKASAASTPAPSEHFIPTPDPRDVLLSFRDRVEHIWDKCGFSKASRKAFFDAPLLLFTRNVLTLPAIDQDRTSSQVTLLESALFTIELAPPQEATLGPNPSMSQPLMQRYPDRYRSYLHFIASLIAHLGKTFQLSVSAFHPSRRPDASIREWNPLDEDLSTYLTRHNARGFTARHRSEHDPSAPDANGIFLQHRILSPEIVEFLEKPAALAIFARLLSLRTHSASHPRSEAAGAEAIAPSKNAATADQSILLGKTHSADHNRNKHPGEAMPSPSSRPSNEAILRWFLDELRQDIATGKIRVNRAGGQVYCGARFTFVAVPRGVQSAADATSSRLLQHQLPPLTKDKRHAGLLDLLATTGATLTYGANRRSIIVKANIGPNIKALSGALFRNDLLWQEESGGSSFPGLFNNSLQLAPRNGPDPILIRGFLSTNAHNTSVEHVLAELRSRKDARSLIINRVDGDVLVFGKVALILNPPRSADEIDRHILSDLTLHLPGRKRIVVEALVIPTSSMGLADATSIEGHFRFALGR